MSEKIKCVNCGEMFEENEMVEIEDGMVCQDCCDNDYFYCEECGEYCHNNYAVETQDGWVCEHCVNNNYTRCDCCGEYCHNHYIYTTADNYELCQSCWENETYYCECCEENYYHEEGEWCEERDAWICNNCYDECCEDNSLIKGYYYKPSPEFQGNGKWYYGIELEIGRINEDKYELAEKLQEEFDFIYLKEDGSLENGFEIVTHPLSFNFIKDCGLFEKVEELFYKKAKAYNRGGMHIHISRSAFKNDRHLKKFMWFINNNKKFTEFIAQRKEIDGAITKVTQ